MSFTIHRKLIKTNPEVVIIRKIKRGHGIMEPSRIRAVNGEWSSDITDTYWNMNSIEDGSNIMSEPSEQRHERFHGYMFQNNTGNFKQQNQKIKKSQITPNQKRILIQYMRQHNNFAMGIMKGEFETKQYQTMWEFLKSKLNLCGPPKSIKQWKVAWKEIKNDVRKRSRFMLEALAKEQNGIWNNFDKEIFDIINKNLPKPIESNCTITQQVAPSCIVSEKLEETNVDNNFGTDSTLGANKTINNQKQPQVTQVDSLSEPTVPSQKFQQSFQNILNDAEGNAYLDFMRETNKGLEDVSKSIQNLAQAQTELQKIESERNAIFRNCLSVFKNIALNLNLMEQPKEERTLDEFDDVE